MSFPLVSAHPLPFPPRDLQVLWDSLSREVRRGLQTQGVDNAALFRHLFDGTLEDAAAVAREFGGATEDAELLVFLWKGLATSAAGQQRRLAAMSSAEVHVAAELHRRKRGEHSGGASSQHIDGQGGVLIPGTLHSPNWAPNKRRRGSDDPKARETPRGHSAVSGFWNFAA